MNKLNFGCGSVQPLGWVNVDSDESFDYEPGNKNNFFFKDTSTFKDNSFDIIVAHAVLQMVEWHEMVVQLKELHRILKSGGVLRISLPDILKGFYAYTTDNIKFFPNSEEKIDDRFSAWLTWYSTSKTLLTEHALINKLWEAGFYHVAPADFKTGLLPEAWELDTREGEFFFMEATK